QEHPLIRLFARAGGISHCRDRPLRGLRYHRARFITTRNSSETLVMRTAQLTFTVLALLGLTITGSQMSCGAPPQPAPATIKTAAQAAPSKDLAAKSSGAPAGVGALDWGQWAGSSARNNAPEGKNIPTEWNIGAFDPKTGKWIKDDAKNIKWVAALGSQSYGNPVVANGQVYVGSNNGAGYLKRYPA